MRTSHVIYQVVHLALVDLGFVHEVAVFFFSDKVVHNVRRVDNVHRVLHGLSLRFSKRRVSRVHHFVIGLHFQVLYWQGKIETRLQSISLVLVV